MIRPWIEHRNAEVRMLLMKQQQVAALCHSPKGSIGTNT